MQSSFESLDPNRQFLEHGSESVDNIVNAIDAHIPEQVQLSTKVKNIASESNILNNYTLNDDKGCVYDVKILTRVSNSLYTHHTRLKESSITKNVKEWSTLGILPSNRNRRNQTTRSNFTTLMSDDTIASNRPSIQ